MDIGGWLRNLSLERYEPLFMDNAIDCDVLPELTEGDLEKLGIPMGDRKRLIKAIRAMLAGSPPTLTSGVGEDRQTGQPRGAAERRHLTVMICDLVGSTALAARLDPEDMRAVIDAYHAACARITLTYDGFLAEFRGDGILAYFGYPIAHEDDAERTVRAGLDIIAAVARLETRAAEPLAVRIGIATGVVVIGDLSREGALREHAVVGETPNLAARLQALAEPGTIVLAASTRRLLGELFHLRDLGRHEVKGIAEPVPAWAVEGVSASESRFEAELHHMRGKTLLTLGRKSEVEAELQRALTIAQQQQARWWELRAATSLAKYWYDEGKYLEAYSLLQPVYSWFVEGFDTTYLGDAKALLGQLRDLSGPQAQKPEGDLRTGQPTSVPSAH